MQQPRSSFPCYHVRAYRASAVAFLLVLSMVQFATAQTDLPTDTIRADPSASTYPNTAAGEFTPGKGFQLVKNQFASLNISLYMMARYVNQLPASDTWEDHLGNTREFKGRNDIYWHRSMIWFTGHVGTP